MDKIEETISDSSDSLKESMSTISVTTESPGEIDKVDNDFEKFKQEIVIEKDLNFDGLHQALPSKLKHIKNQKFLDYTYNPLVKKYVKQIWAYKKTKLDRIKRDLIWAYYRHRGTKLAAQALRDTFYKNIKHVMIIYFDDPVQYKFELTDEMIQILKEYCKTKEIKKPKKTPEEREAKKLRQLQLKQKRLEAKLAAQKEANTDEKQNLILNIKQSDEKEDKQNIQIENQKILEINKTENNNVDPKDIIRLKREKKKLEKKERREKEKEDGKKKKGKISKYPKDANGKPIKNKEKYNKNKIKKQNSNPEQILLPPVPKVPIPSDPNYQPRVPRDPNYQPRVPRDPNYQPRVPRDPNYQPRVPRDPNYQQRVYRKEYFPKVVEDDRKK